VKFNFFRKLHNGRVNITKSSIIMFFPYEPHTKKPQKPPVTSGCQSQIFETFICKVTLASNNLHSANDSTSHAHNLLLHFHAPHPTLKRTSKLLKSTCPLLTQTNAQTLTKGNIPLKVRKTQEGGLNCVSFFFDFS